MKYLTVIRHAKSSWKNTPSSDFDRPLNKRGKKDGPRMNAWLARSNLLPDIVLCSPAVRAVDTLAMLTCLARAATVVQFVPEIYDASLLTLVSLITSVPDSCDHCAVIGHNPGLHDIVNFVSASPVGSLPTLAVVQLTLNVSCWKSVNQSCASPLVFMSPKLLKDGLP